MRKVDYDDRLHAVYARGRALSADALATWGDAFERRAPADRPLAVVDVGSGTGRFTPLLADRFGGPVVGVEPSDRMRTVGEQESAHPAVRYAAGSAEALPLEDGSCDLALLFFVWHHVVDKAAAAAELARVVSPGGVVLFRTGLRDRMPDLWWYHHFPGVREIDAAMFDTLDQMRAVLAPAGWTFVALDSVEYEVSPSRRDYVERLQTRSLSTFEHLTEEELDAGFVSLEQAVADDPGPPVVETGNLLSFRRG